MLIINLQTDCTHLHLYGKRKKKAGVKEKAEFFYLKNTERLTVEERHNGCKGTQIKLL